MTNPELRVGAAFGLILLALYLLYRYGAVIVPLLMLLHAVRAWQARTSAVAA